VSILFGTRRSLLSLATPSAAPTASATPPAGPAPDLWMDPALRVFSDTAGTTPAADGGALGNWTDGSAHAYPVTQATGTAQPTLASNSGFKARPGVRYTSAQYLSNAAAPLMNSRAAGTVMVAFRSDNFSPPGGAIFSTTQDQLGILSNGRVALNTAAAEWGTMDGAQGMLSTSGGQVVTVVYDGTQAGNAGRLRCWRNLLEETLAYTGTISATSYAGGQALYLGREAAGAGWAQTTLEVLFWRGLALATADRQAWENYLAAKYFAKVGRQMVVDGDSNSVGSPNNVSNPWPKRATAALGGAWAAEVSGGTVGKLLSQGSSSPLLSWRDDWLTAQPYVVALGTNDLAVNHATLATLQGYANTLIATLKKARYPAFFCTIPAAGANIAGTDETTRVSFNSWLAGVAGISVVDIATALGTPPNGNFEGDDLHLTSAGSDVVSGAVVTALRAAGY
jgi:hypothetical protein